MGDSVIDIIIRASNKAKQALREPINDLADLKGVMAGLAPAAAAAGAAVAYALERIVARSIDGAEQLNAMSQRTGVAVEALSTLKFAAEQSEIEMEAFEGGMKKMAVSAFEAANGNKELAQTYKALKVNLVDANGAMLPADAILRQVADAFQRMPDGVNKSATAVKLFGKAGTEMIPLLNEGGAGIAKLQAQARGLGLEISGATAKAADDFNDKMHAAASLSTGFGNAIMGDILPGLNAMMDGLLSTGEEGFNLGEIMQGVGHIISDLVLRPIMSVFEGVLAVINTVATTIAAVMTTIVEVMANGWHGLGKRLSKDWSDTWDTIQKETQKSADTISAIWDDKKGVGVPDAKAHEDALARINNANKEAADLKKMYHELEAGQHDQDMAWLEDLKGKNIEEAQAAVDAKLKELQSKIIYGKAEVEFEKGLYKTKKELAKKAAEEKALGERASWDKIAELSHSANKVLSAIGKAAAIRNAIIDGKAAVISAYRNVPFPLNFPAAALVAATVGAEISDLAGLPAFAGGGIVPGTDSSGDRVIVRANAGELILNEAQQENVASRIGGSGDTILYLDGDVLARWMNRASRSGRLQIN